MNQRRKRGELTAHAVRFSIRVLSQREVEPLRILTQEKSSMAAGIYQDANWFAVDLPGYRRLVVVEIDVPGSYSSFQAPSAGPVVANDSPQQSSEVSARQQKKAVFAGPHMLAPRSLMS